MKTEDKKKPKKQSNESGVLICCACPKAIDRRQKNNAKTASMSSQAIYFLTFRCEEVRKGEITRKEKKNTGRK